MCSFILHVHFCRRNTMAEFCKQCADDLGFSESDLIDPNLRKGLYVTALC